MAVSNVTLHHECCYMGAFVSWTDAGRERGRMPHPHPHPDASIGRTMITGVYVEAHMKRFVKEASHEAFVIGTDAEGATTIRLRGMTEKP